MSSTSPEIVCPICFDGFTDPSEMIRACSDHSHAGCHQECLQQYIHHQIDSAFPGFCPAITCPSEHDNKLRLLLNYEVWSIFIDARHVNQYSELASSTLAFLCGGCHSLRSQLAQTNPSTKSQALVNLQPRSDPESLQQLQDILQKFEVGLLNVHEVFSFLDQSFSQLSTLDEREAFDNIFKHILLLVSNPERRSMLHIRHLNRRPRFFTNCCQREHCFRCRTRDFHTGKTCEQNTASLDSSFLPCPGCGTMLTKGDGCNSVTCVCKRQFSWSEEKDNFERSNVFSSAYPTDTAKFCAEALCLIGPSASASQNANAWRRKNEILCDQALRKVWFDQHQRAAHQCCLIPSIRDKNTGFTLAANLWEKSNKDHVEKCRKQQEIAQDIEFESRFSKEELPIEVVRVLQSSDPDPKFIAAATRWKEKNQGRYFKALTDFQFRSANQFLCLFGKDKVSTFEIDSSSAGPSVWDRSISNRQLQFSDEDTSVKRPGGVSSYPASFARLTGPICSFSVEVLACVQDGNYITFGVSKTGRFATEGSDGVGLSSESWGFNDERAGSCDRPMVVAENRSRVDSCRKLREGDVMTAEIDTLSGTLRVSLNHVEYSHTFSIPPASQDEYLFTMTFANNHKVRILPPSMSITSVSSSSLNKQHKRNLLHLRNLLNAILTYSGQNHKGAKAGILARNNLLPVWGWDLLKICSDEWTEAVRGRLQSVKSMHSGLLRKRHEEHIEQLKTGGEWIPVQTRRNKKDKGQSLATPFPPPPEPIPVTFDPLVTPQDLQSGLRRSYHSLRPSILRALGLSKLLNQDPTSAAAPSLTDRLTLRPSPKALKPVDQSALHELLLMGFDPSECASLLRRSNNDVNAAVNRLLDGSRDIAQMVREDQQLESDLQAYEVEKATLEERRSEELAKKKERELERERQIKEGKLLPSDLLNWEELNWREMVGAIVWDFYFSQQEKEKESPGKAEKEEEEETFFIPSLKKKGRKQRKKSTGSHHSPSTPPPSLRRMSS